MLEPLVSDAECVATAGPPLHTGGSGSQTGSGQTYLSPRVLGFQVGDRRARRVVLGMISCQPWFPLATDLGLLDLAHAASLTVKATLNSTSVPEAPWKDSWLTASDV